MKKKNNIKRKATNLKKQLLYMMLWREPAPKEKTKKWEYIKKQEPKYDIDGKKTWAAVYKCPNCGFIHTVIEDFGLYRYCPNCGCDMRGAYNEIE